jgi:hypothetical protein
MGPFLRQKKGYPLKVRPHVYEYMYDVRYERIQKV